ncbi:MAG: hypothetical protein FD148_1709 [Methylocystaceae bacterium]|nr:MAG: hypothetical protein FD148_1709 [Methylocystaceae bacterium]TND00710.1 MAG: hypothetical protein FD120_2737 [Gammaproteobacteria bacterium]
MLLPRRTTVRFLVAILLLSTFSPASAFADAAFSLDAVRYNLTYVAGQLASFFSDLADAIALHIPVTSLTASAATPTPSPIAPPSPALDFLAMTTPEASTPPTTVAAPYAPQTTIIQQPVIERVVERTVPAPAASGISEQTLANRLASLKDDILLRIAAVASAPISFSGSAPTTPVSTATFATSQRIDQLTNTAINAPTITGGSISGANVSGYLPLSGGTLTGTLFGTDLSLSGTLSAGTLNVAGVSSQGALVGPYFTATSTTATSTFAGGLTAANGGFSILQNGNVGIGTQNPTAELAIEASGTNGIDIRRAGSVFGTGIRTFASRGTTASPTQSQTNDTLGNFEFWGLDDTGVYRRPAYIAAKASENLTAASSAGYLSFFTAPTGSVNTTERLRITSSGNVGVGTTSPTNKLEVAGNTFLGGTITGTSTLALTGTTGTTTIASGQGFTIGGSQFVVQQGSGNVGIGTTTPTAMLDITGNKSDAVVGSEMISATADRDFSSDSGNWTGTNWSIGSGVDTHTAGANALTLTNAALASAPASGNLYQITFTLVTTIAGTVTPNIGSANGLAVGTVVGSDTETQVIAATGSGALTFTPDATWTGTIDNVSVKQVTKSSAVQVFRSSNSTIGSEIRSGGVSHTTNTFMGVDAGSLNTTGNRNTAFGAPALISNTTGFRNSAFGSAVLSNNTIGNQNTALGVSAMQSNTIGSNNTSVGYRSLFVSTSGSTNTAIGQEALVNITTGSNNVALGFRSGLNLTTGTKNIIIGYNINATSSSATNSLNIGNLIFSAGLDGSGSTISTGNVGIGTTTPTNKLEVAGNTFLGGTITGTSTLALTGTTGTTTIAAGQGFTIGGSQFVVQQGSGNVGIGTTTPTAQLSTTGTVRFAGLGSGGANLVTDALGNVTAASDERLKDKQGDFTRGLAAVNAISPVLYKWRPETGFDTQSTYAGFFAQNVQAAIPEAVSPDSRGYLTLADRPILAALVNAVKELATKLDTFAERFTTKQLTFVRGEADDLTLNQRLCIKNSAGTPVCVTGDQLAALLGQTGAAAAPASVIPSAPVIELNGNASSTIDVGDTYNDLGASIVAPASDLNLGLVILLDGATTTQVSIDTSTPAEHTILYTVTSPTTGLTSTIMRTVSISPATQLSEPPANDNPFNAPDNDNASSTTAVDAAA